MKFVYIFLALAIGPFAVFALIVLGHVVFAPVAVPPSGHPYLSITSQGDMRALGDDATVTFTVRNSGATTRVANLQAFFYRVPVAALTSDPAADLVTAGYTSVTIDPGVNQSVTIHAKNFNHDDITSSLVEFTPTR